MNDKLSIIIPAKNEESGISIISPILKSKFPEAEVIVVDDGSDDSTYEIARKYEFITVKHNYSKGNGAAIKTGVRTATGDILVFMDADGQHDPQNINLLLNEIKEGADMVVGARTSVSQASVFRLVANTIYNKFSSYMVGHEILDLTSGFRAVKADKFRKILYMLPNGFSYPSTSTMAFFRSGHTVKYITIEADKRIGKSHINLIRDGYRFLLILFKIGTLFSPLKIFAPVSMLFFSTGIMYYLYTFLTAGRFTNMAALLLITSVLIFLIGLISEQITMLIYSREE